MARLEGSRRRKKQRLYGRKHFNQSLWFAALPSTTSYQQKCAFFYIFNSAVVHEKFKAQT